MPLNQCDAQTFCIRFVHRIFKIFNKNIFIIVNKTISLCANSLGKRNKTAKPYLLT